MDLEGEVSQTEKAECCAISILCGIVKKRKSSQKTEQVGGWVHGWGAGRGRRQGSTVTYLSTSFFANPKSVSFTCPSLSSRMFSGFKSRYTISLECRYSRAQTISAE